MKKILFLISFILTVLIIDIATIYGQGGWTANLLVYDESYVAGSLVYPTEKSEYNVEMRVDLYDNYGNPVQPGSSYLYNWWRRSPNSSNPSDYNWYSWQTNTGDNIQATHTYINSTEPYAGLFDVYCIVTIPDVDTVTSNTIRIPWYRIVPDQKKNNGNSFGSVNYWYKGSFKDNNGLNTIYIPRYDPKVLQAETNVVFNPQEKYQLWNDDRGNTYYTNFINFIPEDLFVSMTSQFKYTKDATVLTKVDNVAYENVISFTDPWLRDFNEPPYGLRNQGLSAQPHTLTNVDNNIGINSNYKGVFLDQRPNIEGVYYSVQIGRAHV